MAKEARSKQSLTVELYVLAAPAALAVLSKLQSHFDLGTLLDAVIKNWRAVTHQLWTDAFLSIQALFQVPLPPPGALDVLTFSILVIGASLWGLGRGIAKKQVESSHEHESRSQDIGSWAQALALPLMLFVFVSSNVISAMIDFMGLNLTPKTSLLDFFIIFLSVTCATMTMWSAIFYTLTPRPIIIRLIAFVGYSFLATFFLGFFFMRDFMTGHGSEPVKAHDLQVYLETPGLLLLILFIHAMLFTALAIPPRLGGAQLARIVTVASVILIANIAAELLSPLIGHLQSVVARSA